MEVAGGRLSGNHVTIVVDEASVGTNRGEPLCLSLFSQTSFILISPTVATVWPTRFCRFLLPGFDHGGRC